MKRYTPYSSYEVYKEWKRRNKASREGFPSKETIEQRLIRGDDDIDIIELLDEYDLRH